MRDSLGRVRSGTRRSTIYLDPEVHRVLRLRAAETNRAISDLVNDAVRLSLAEDVEDLGAFDERAREKSMSFEKGVREMRRRGHL